MKNNKYKQQPKQNRFPNFTVKNRNSLVKCQKLKYNSLYPQRRIFIATMDMTGHYPQYLNI